MTNNIVSLDFNGVKVLLDSNTKLVRLTVPASTAADTTYHDSSDDSNYQVPTGKKATIIYIEQYRDNAGTGGIIYADDADGQTNAVSLFTPNIGTQIDNLPFISAEIPADKFINYNYVSGTGATVEHIIYVIEEDA